MSVNGDAAAVARLVLEHSGLRPSADVVSLIGHAAAVAAESFRHGSPTPDTVEDAIRDGVRAALAVLPVDLPKPARGAIGAAVVAALGWLWRELQPAVVVDAGDSVLVVTIDEDAASEAGEDASEDEDPPEQDPSG